MKQDEFQQQDVMNEEYEALIELLLGMGYSSLPLLADFDINGQDLPDVGERKFRDQDFGVHLEFATR